MSDEEEVEGREVKERKKRGYYTRNKRCGG
jgi:hypothetical protein